MDGRRPPALSIESVIGSRIPVTADEWKRNGDTFVQYSATCPFCRGTYALDIMPGSQSWACDSCEAGGDVFSFLMQYHNIPFATALRMLQDKLREEEGR